jgi:nucleotide-binding universal stress UspA family protein
MLVEGPSAQALLHVAEGADLLVVGSRGRGGFARLLLGSVGHQCASHADVPTVIVPSTTEPGDLALVKVGVDGSPNSLAALRWACRHVPATATVEAIQMWSPPELGIDGLDPRILEDMAEAAERRFRAKVTEVQAEVDTTIAVRFVHDDARRRLAEESAAADLVVVGSRGRRGLTGAILGSVATWLLHHTVCPVAVVPG